MASATRLGSSKLIDDPRTHDEDQGAVADAGFPDHSVLPFVDIDRGANRDAVRSSRLACCTSKIPVSSCTGFGCS